MEFKSSSLYHSTLLHSGFSGGASGKESAANAGDTRDLDSILGQEDPLEEEMATHSSILTMDRGAEGYSPMGSQRVRYD